MTDTQSCTCSCSPSHPTIINSCLWYVNDLTTFQKGASYFFSSYIQRGLKIIECDIAAERQGATLLSDSAFANALVSGECLEPMFSFLYSFSY